MSSSKIQLGTTGEEAAVAFLRKRGYRIVDRNVRTKFGEIDIVALDKGVVCFIEVKTRRSDAFGSPADALSLRKQRHLSKAALAYIKQKHLTEKDARFDLVGIIQDEQGAVTIDIVPDAFALSSPYAY